jgi:type IV secretory pathway VirB2 component (pilin)
MLGCVLERAREWLIRGPPNLTRILLSSTLDGGNDAPITSTPTEGSAMTRLGRFKRSRGGLIRRRGPCIALVFAVALGVPSIASAQASPWENAVNVLMVSFTGPIARGLSLVSIVVGGITFAFGEGGSKRLLAGIVFGVGMAIGAVNFMAWLFP